jgi:hypothetical protein
MEIGWYLRLSGKKSLTFLVKKNLLATLEDQKATVSGWNLAVTEREDCLEAVFTRS